MAETRTVTINVEGGEPVVYQNVPKEVTPDQIEARFTGQFPNTKILSIDGGLKPKVTTEKTIPERIVAAGMRGAPSGPLGVVSQLGTEAMQIGGEALDKAAYKAGGAVTDLTGSPEAGLAANVALQAVPAVLGGGPAKAAAPLMEAGATRLMQSALKPTLEALKTGKAARAIDTLLEEGINATSGGVRKLRDMIGELNTQVQSAIAASPARVDGAPVARAIGETLQKFRMQATPAADEKAIKGVWDEFKNTWLSGGSMSVQDAQAVKQGTQRTVAKAYGKLSDAETEAQKSVARGLREEISAKVPEVAGLNKRESDLINALNVTERRALMDANKNPMGLALLAHSPVGWAAFMADKSALFKSLMARMLNTGQEQIPATAARVGIGLGEGINNQP